MWWQIVTGLQTRGDAAGLITWAVSVDSTTARAHQHALLATAELVRRERARSASHDVSSTGHADNGRPACCGCGELSASGGNGRDCSSCSVGLLEVFVVMARRTIHSVTRRRQCANLIDQHDPTIRMVTS